jgi:excisionase family DNA binding protein
VLAQLADSADTKLAPPSPYMSVVEAAEWLRSSRQRVDDLCSQGKLTRFKEGSRTLISRDELAAYVKNGKRR